MRGGGANSFVAVPLLADNGLITKAYLNDMQAAIRQRTPISGENINIKVTDGSYVISATAGLGGGVPTPSYLYLSDFQITVLAAPICFKENTKIL